MGTEAVGEIEQVLGAKGIDVFDCPITGEHNALGIKRSRRSLAASGFERVKPLIEAFAVRFSYGRPGRTGGGEDGQ